MSYFGSASGMNIDPSKVSARTVGRSSDRWRWLTVLLVLSLPASGCERGEESRTVTVSPPSGLPIEPVSGVDVLFVVDNRSATIPFQHMFADSLQRFVRRLEAMNVDYHLGVVTSDVGSTMAPGHTWEMADISCNTFAGDNGVLQAIPCTFRPNGTPDARSACSRVCTDDRFAPLDGRRYIAKERGHTNVPNDLSRDPETGMTVNRGPGRALACLAMVGDTGCTIRGMLEGARRALDPANGANAGFLRPRSVLAVFFITDEEDCSVQLARRSENNPATIDCSTPDQDASYRCFHPYYRCTAMSVRCSEPMNSVGPKTNCKERQDNYLEPTGAYVRFLRSLRPAERLVVRGLWALPSLQQHGKLVIRNNSRSSDTLFVSGADEGACQLSAEPLLAASAQHRLSQFAADLGFDSSGRKVAGEASICKPEDYGTVLNEFATEIEARLK